MKENVNKLMALSREDTGVSRESFKDINTLIKKCLKEKRRDKMSNRIWSVVFGLRNIIKATFSEVECVYVEILLGYYL